MDFKAKLAECALFFIVYPKYLFANNYFSHNFKLGNVGAIVGPPFFDALDSTIGDNAVQGVAYPADILGFLEGGDPVGSSTMAQLVTRAASQCPDTAIVMSGYRYESHPFDRVDLHIYDIYYSSLAYG